MLSHFSSQQGCNDLFNADNKHVVLEMSPEKAQNPPPRTQKLVKFDSDDDENFGGVTLANKSMVDIEFERMKKRNRRRKSSIIADDELINGRIKPSDACQKYSIPEAVPVTLEYLQSFQRLESNVGIISVKTAFVGVFVSFVLLLGIGLISISANFSGESNVLQSDGAIEIQSALLNLFNVSNTQVIKVTKNSVNDLVFMVLEQVSFRIQASLTNLTDTAHTSASELGRLWINPDMDVAGVDLDRILVEMWANLLFFPTVHRLRFFDDAAGNYISLARKPNSSAFVVEVRNTSAAACRFCPSAASPGAKRIYAAAALPQTGGAFTLLSEEAYDPSADACYLASLSAGPDGRTILAPADAAQPAAGLVLLAGRPVASAGGARRGAVCAEVLAEREARFLATAKRQLRRRLAAVQRSEAAAALELVVVDERGALVASSADDAVGQPWAAVAAQLSGAARTGLQAVGSYWGGNWTRMHAVGGGAGASAEWGDAGLLRTYAHDSFFVGSLPVDDGRGLRLAVVVAAAAGVYRGPIDAALSGAAERVANLSAVTDGRIRELRNLVGQALRRNQTMQIVLSFGVLVCGTILVHFFAKRVTQSLSRLAAQMERVAVFDFGEESSLDATNASLGSMEVGNGAPGAGHALRWVQATSLLTEVAAIGRSFALMSLNLRSFERYVPEGVVRLLASKESVARLGVAHREVSIMFSDIVGFTTMAEALEPEILIEVLAEYLEAMSSCVERSGGTVGKYIGDAIMAFWNSPNTVDGHAAAACSAALEQQHILAALRRRLAARGLPPLHARMGLSSGTVLHGNIGSRRRMEWNLIGDEVNLAARLESMCKQYGVEILISGRMRQLAGEAFIARRVDRVVAYGRRGATDIYELVATQGTASSEQVRYCRNFDAVFECYLGRRFEEARSLALAFEADFPGDIAALRCIERCERYIAKPPPDDWDGAAVLTSK